MGIVWLISLIGGSFSGTPDNISSYSFSHCCRNVGMSSALYLVDWLLSCRDGGWTCREFDDSGAPGDLSPGSSSHSFELVARVSLCLPFNPLLVIFFGSSSPPSEGTGVVPKRMVPFSKSIVTLFIFMNGIPRTMS